MSVRGKPKDVPFGYAYAYCRVSTARQAAEGDSLESQQQAIERYCQYRNWPFDPRVQLYVDRGVSAFKTDLGKREAGKRLVQRLRPGDQVVITMLDRAFRRLGDCCNQVEEWHRRSIGLHITNACGGTIDTTTAGGRLQQQVFGMFAEYDSNIRAERARLQHALAARKGQRGRTGWPPLGFRWSRGPEGPVLVRYDAERELMARVYRWWCEGWSYVEIREHLEYRLKHRHFRLMGIEGRKELTRWSDRGLRNWALAEHALLVREGADPDTLPDPNVRQKRTRA